MSHNSAQPRWEPIENVQRTNDSHPHDTRVDGFPGYKAYAELEDSTEDEDSENCDDAEVDDHELDMTKVFDPTARRQCPAATTQGNDDTWSNPPTTQENDEMWDIASASTDHNPDTSNNACALNEDTPAKKSSTYSTAELQEAADLLTQLAAAEKEIHAAQHDSKVDTATHERLKNIQKYTHQILTFLDKDRIERGKSTFDPIVAPFFDTLNAPAPTEDATSTPKQPTEIAAAAETSELENGWGDEHTRQTVQCGDNWSSEQNNDRPATENSGPQIFHTADPRHIGIIHQAQGRKPRLVGQPNATPLTSPSIAGLLAVDGKVRGYTPSALKAIGGNPNAAVRTTISYVREATYPLTVRIKCTYTLHGSTFTAFYLELPIGAWTGPPDITQHSRNDDVIARLFGKDPTDSATVINSSVATTFTVRWNSACWLHAVRLPIQNENDAENTKLIKQLVMDMWTLLDAPNADQRTITVLTTPDQTVISGWIKHFETEFNRVKVNTETQWAQTSAFFLDPKNPTQLGWKTIQANQERPAAPNASRIAFHDNKTHILALQMSSFEEYELDAAVALELEQREFKGLFIPDPTSAWDTQDEECGIPTDGTVRRYLAVVDIENDVRHLLPAIGQPLALKAQVETPERRIPPAEDNDPDHDTRVAVRHLLKEATQLQRLHEEAVETQQATTRDATMTVAIADSFRGPIDANFRTMHGIPQDLPLDSTRIHVAKRMLKHFYPLPQVQDDDTINMLVQTFQHTPLRLARDANSIRWRATRIKTPPHTDTSKMYLLVHTPREQGWPKHFTSPPMPFRLPQLDLLGDLRSVMSNTANHDKVTTFSMSYEADTATVKAEMDAVQAMASAAAGTFQDIAFRYLSRASTSEPPRDMTSSFPALKDYIVETTPNSPYQELDKSITRCPAGMTFYTGGPGSGKTTWGIKLLKALDGYNAAWSVHSNSLCDDAADKLGATCQGAVVARVYTYERMLRALTGQTEYSQVVRSAASPQHSKAQRQVVKTIANFDDTARQNNPLARTDSLVSIALSVAEDNLDFDEFNALRASARKTDEQMTALVAQANRLLAHTLAQVNILVGTPVALGSIARASKLEQDSTGKWNPHIIFVDETGRMPESQFYIPIAFFKPTWVIATGDTQQINPMSKSLDMNGVGETDARWRSTFGPQRTTSILRRMEKLGAVASKITINRRNIGAIADWARKTIYNRQMTIRYGSGGLVAFFTDLGNQVMRGNNWNIKSTVNSFVVDVREGRESTSGTSKLNDANVNYTMWLIFQLFGNGFPSTHDTSQQGNLMIIAAYNAQRQAYEDAFNASNADDNMRARVTIRSIDDSMSAEADVVIMDTVRSQGMGFLPQKPRMAVAVTRARGLAICLVNTSEWEKRGNGQTTVADNTRVNHLIGYYNWHVANQAVKETGCGKVGFNLICTKCGLGGHPEQKCKVTSRKCRNCKGDHHERFCAVSTFQTRTTFRPKSKDNKLESFEPGINNTDKPRYNRKAKHTMAQIAANAKVNPEPDTDTALVDATQRIAEADKALALVVSADNNLPHVVAELRTRIEELKGGNNT